MTRRSAHTWAADTTTVQVEQDTTYPAILGKRYTVYRNGEAVGTVEGNSEGMSDRISRWTAYTLAGTRGRVGYEFHSRAAATVALIYRDGNR